VLKEGRARLSGTIISIQGKMPIQSSPKSSPRERTLMQKAVRKSPLSFGEVEMSEGQRGEDSIQ
jgi:hypothetical protein